MMCGGGTQFSCILLECLRINPSQKKKNYNEMLPQSVYWQNALDEKNASSPTLPSLRVSHQNHPGHLHHQEQQPSPAKNNLIYVGIFLRAKILTIEKLNIM